MDAFVVRSARAAVKAVTAPPEQLFARDCVRLVLNEDDDGVDVGEAAARLRCDIEAHGGSVVSTWEIDEREKDIAAVTLLVVGSPDGSLVDAARRLHPRAGVVSARWVRACVREQRRLPIDVNSVEASNLPGGAEEDVAESRPCKRVRVGEETAAVSSSASQPRDGSLVERGDASAATVDVGAPDLSRSWKTVAGGALHFLDARAAGDSTGDSGSGRAAATKLAAFDLDGTLIVTKSGKRFAQHAADWKLLDAARVCATLRRLAREGFALVILSNQHGVAKGKTTADAVRRKMEAVVARLGVPMLVLFATQDDEMRKPRTGAWRWLLRELGVKNDAVDATASLYCGDAAGRPKIAGRSKDFAATDYKFALNAGLQFVTPEALFLKSTQRIHTRPEMWEIDFDPRGLPTGSAPLLEPASTALVAGGNQELVVLVGPPASGKSHFAKRFAGYEVVCQDDLKTAAKCVAAGVSALQAGMSVVVDSTNRDPRGRKDWVALAQKHHVGVRCFFMDVAKPLSMHLNTFRKLTSSKEIPDIAIHTFYKNYVVPTKEEGFDAVAKVRFCVDLDSLPAEHRHLIMSFL